MGRLILFGLSILILSACGSGGGSGVAVSSAIPDLTPGATTPTPTPSPAPAPVAITYYSLTRSVSQTAPAPAVPFTGSCTTYLSNTYCWDDGEKIAGSNSYTFWGMNGSMVRCDGNCASDGMTAPTTIDSNVLLIFNQGAPMDYNPGSGLNPVQYMLTNGAVTNVSCTSSGTIIDCGSFQIDLDQTPL